MQDQGFEFARSRTLQQAIAESSRADFAEAVEAAEAERRQIQERFPREEWSEMSLEEYALGQENVDDSYSWWLEFNSPHLGSIAGGASSKHLIYCHGQEPGWYYPDGFEDRHAAWEAIRSAFLQAFELAEEDDLRSVDENEQFSGGPAVVSKTLTVYFPETKLPIHSKTHLRHFLDELGLEDAYTRADRTMRLNRLLFDELQTYPELTDWRPKELERLLYSWSDPRETTRVVKISPGPEAELWEDCREHGYIRVGWERTGDLQEYKSKRPFKNAFKETYFDEYDGDNSTLGKKANEVWTLRELQPGDVVVANDGKSRVLAVGRVVEPGYRWLDDREAFNHAVSVDWNTNYAQTIPTRERWGAVTVTDVADELFGAILSHEGGERGGETRVVMPARPIYERIADALEAKGQAILHGPPGTGKTYNARKFARWWLSRQIRQGDGDLAGRIDRAQTVEQLDSELAGGEEVGPLTTMTFHPSYTYEDFVEGFKPAESDGDAIDLKLIDGVFKRVCRQAARHPQRPHLLLVDEINRANLSKVFGELITLLERDKRGMTVTLPQSKEAFRIPPNVYILGTMNTVDRSLRHMDAALRRRFRFIEMMPELELLRGAEVGELRVDDFLEDLNRRVVRREGREKQIGHSYLMVDGTAVSEPEDFADLFRYEILPLLQEYCYDDFTALSEYLGGEIVDREGRRFNEELLAEPDALVEVLAGEFNGGGVA